MRRAFGHPLRWMAAGAGALVVTIYAAVSIGLNVPSLRPMPLAPWADAGFGVDRQPAAAPPSGFVSATEQRARPRVARADRMRILSAPVAPRTPRTPASPSPRASTDPSSPSLPLPPLPDLPGAVSMVTEVLV